MATTGVCSVQIRSHGRIPFGIAVAGAVLFSLFLPAAHLRAQAGRAQEGPRMRIPTRSPFPPSTSKPSNRKTERQKEALAKYNFKQMKKHADELSELAQSLQKKIGESNENVLSLDVVRNAAKIEKLAKKIKNEAKGY